MLVFDETFVAKMRRRYDGDLHRRPLVAKVAAHPDWSAEREWIEETVSLLHPDDQAPMAHKLREKFISTYGELHVGCDLLRAGCTIRYDSEYLIQGNRLTPDWTAQFDGATFICEVFTAGLLNSRRLLEEHAMALSERLSKIVAPYLVKMEVSAEGDLTDADRKRIAGEFNEATLLGMPVGAVWRTNGCAIEILGPASHRVEVVTLDPVHLVPTPSSIRETIKEKSAKYAVLGSPILVAAVRHPLAEAEMMMFEDIVCGKLVHKSVQMPEGRIIARTCRQTDGVFERRPELSAAMWRNPYTIHPDKELAMFENDRAVRPLPQSFVERLRSLYPERG